MLDYINNFISETFTFISIPNIQVIDVIEIIILAVFIHQIAKRIVDTRILTVTKGILVLLALYGILEVTQLNVIASIFKWFIAICVICIILAVQPELRRIMESAGSHNYINDIIAWYKKDKDISLEFNDNTLNAIVEACEQMSKNKVGALIVFELDAPLKDIIATGIKIDAIITKQLLIQIFEKNTPLHDGALIIKRDRIASATCYLPLSNNLKINKDLGTRHRAGIGVTEQVDCFVIIVSEETGAISWVEDGVIHHKVSIKDLRNKLTKLQHRKDPKKKKVSLAPKTSGKQIKDIIISLSIAIITWIAVINLIDPITSRPFTDIAVEVQNEEVLNNKTQTYEVIDGDSISVIVKGRRSVIDELKKSDIRAFADLEELSIVYSVPIEIKLKGNLSDYVNIAYKSKNTMKLKIDTIAEKVVPIEFETTGEVNADDGTFVNNIICEQDSLTIKGANSIVSTIDRVVLPVDVAEHKDNFETSVKPIIYDRNGNDITNEKLDISQTNFDLTVEMLNTKKVPLKIGLENTESKQYKVIKYQVETTEILVGGESNELNNLEELEIKLDISKDLENLTSNTLVKTIDIKNYLKESFVVKDDNSKINITIEVETPIEKELKISNSDIEIRKVKKGYKCEITDKECALTIKGFKEQLEKITKDDFNVYVNMSSISDTNGEIELIAEFTGDASIEIVKIPNVRYKLSKV